ncbi:MAG TPA: transcriptional repressor LexA [Candidatus Saccharicenans sp.]|nr:transcriptional repressor LexA [Candidatus Saccharicenans sp.]HQO76568.1 transcriptional repressor LexA [Candidatus Saccharicenans sp.]HUM78920.1 transcriptional repressor LexA [Candidatus Saccharicenans sp.]
MVNRIKKTLTRRQKEILDKIQNFILENGYAPTVREIGQMAGLTNPSAVFKHLLSLEKKGYLRREGGELRLSYLPDAVNQVRLPLVGLVPAGSPREMFDTLGESVEVPAWFAGRKSGNLFCLKVTGKSMIDAYIDDGDLVVIERTETANSGEMVVALLEDGTVTLKRLRREKDRVLLVPENPAFKPIEAKEVRIVGRVAGVIRKY